jgi:hypothetical protein
MAVAAIVVTAVAVALILVLSGDGDKKGQAPVATAPSPTTTTTGTAERSRGRKGRRRTRERGRGQPTRAHERKSSRAVRQRNPGTGVERIVVRDGFPVGGVVRLNYQRGQRVLLEVRSDRTDFVRNPGLGQKQPVSANRGARFDFRPRDSGLFGVELEKQSARVAVLAIR